MKLKSLELSGFKSFGKKSRLDFTSPVSCIVGPNGSGKSNVVEAFRFVLGEQSMKSLRGKSGKDLIFKGSSGTAKLSRASVSIVFDNKDKAFKLPSGESQINLDFPEITISREVYADGTNAYAINGSPVRLRDIVELLASVNIGASGHHIISQGHADRILSATPKERRSMIEDALGLKIYQYRLRESEKKLEKTRENIKETEIIRREIAPHLRYLKKQVEKIQKGEELRKELAGLYLSYFAGEHAYVKSEGIRLSSERTELERTLQEVSLRLSSMKDIVQSSDLESRKNEEIQAAEESISTLRQQKEGLGRALGKLDGLIEMEEKRVLGGEGVVSVSQRDFNDFIDDIHGGIDQALALPDLSSVSARLRGIKDTLSSFRQRHKISGDVSRDDLDRLLGEQGRMTKEIEAIDQSIDEQKASVDRLRREIETEKESLYKQQEERFRLESEKERLSASLSVVATKAEAVARRQSLLEDEMKEAVVLVGQEVLGYERASSADVGEQEDIRRQIERIKIRLEDIGTGGGGDVMKEYEEVSGRDTFLIEQLADLEGSVKNLAVIIQELKDTLDMEFKTGLHKINERFEEFFKLMFGGGGAYLSILVEKPKKQDDNMDDLEAFDEDKPLEQGIDINVSLPQKKVKELTMLSGGERSLTSIALLFAMSQVNPPPFLVLDETDAALDEANSKRYGDMLERLSKYSELIVVTHNRETMSRADLIYGVTIGSDGVSKLLSIKFAEAEGYAK